MICMGDIGVCFHSSASVCTVFQVPFVEEAFYPMYVSGTFVKNQMAVAVS